MNITNTEIIILVLKIYLTKLFNWLCLILLKYISDKYLIFTSNNIKYNAYYDTSDSNEELEPIYVHEYEIIKDRFKIDNIINKYKQNKYMNYKKNEYYIINSFLFNFDGDYVSDKYYCTNKIIILFNRFECLNTDKIKLVTNKYKYLYIFYKDNLDNFNVKIIDLNNNINIIDNSELIFNIISL
jgi:hypothetical protein